MFRLNRGKIAIVSLVIMLAITGCGGKKDAKDYYNDGLKQYKSKDFEKASQSFKEAVTKNPNKAEYYIDYGMALIQCENYDEALIQFDKAILDKENKIVRQNNKLAHRGKGIAYFNAAQYQLAVNEFETAYKISEFNDLDIDILFYLGDAQTKLLDNKGALETYSKILKRKPGQSVAYYKRAIIEGNLEQLDQSIADFDKAISYEKDNYEYYFGKYAILVQQGDVDGANEVLSKALAIKTKTKEDYYNVARIHYYQQDYNTAKSELTQAVVDGFASASFYLGEIAMNEKNYEEAVRNYEAFMENSSSQKSAEVYNRLGDAYIEMKDYEKALSTLEEGIMLNDNSVMQSLKSNEIVALEKLGKYKDAYKKAKEFVKAYPDNDTMQEEVIFLKTRQKSALVDNTK